MEINIVICYHGGHETSRKPDATGEAAPTSNPVAKEGQDIVGSGTNGWFFGKLSIPMATGLSKGKGKKGGVLVQAHGDPLIIQLTCISDRIFKELNRLINNLLPQQHRDTLAIVDIKVSKSSESK